MPPSWERLEAGQLWHGLMRASALITAAGTSLWEAAVARIPVVVVCTADNQVAGFDWARQAGVPVIDARQSDRVLGRSPPKCVRLFPLPGRSRR